MQRPGHVSFWSQIGQLPLFLLAFGLATLSMFAPAIHATVVGETTEARAFLYAGTLGLVLFALIGVAMAGRPPRQGPLGPLLSLLSVMVILPLWLAVPLYEGLGNTSFVNAYIEMVGAVTTTGSLIYIDPERLSAPLHLWRAQVAWMGGFVMWSAAAAILAPLNLGGFEITAQAEPGRIESVSGRVISTDTHFRLLRVVVALFPIYAGLTLLLWVLLLIAGDPSLVALCHAMSILSTSGISPVGGIEGAASGVTGEIVMALFFVFALSRLTFSVDTVISSGQGLHTDPEIRLAAVVLITVPLLLFLRHWVGALDVNQEENIPLALRALWGSVFTVLSFLTTTGFTSTDWALAQDWSGLQTPGLILMGLALIGGGVATTAGGVKLLRVFALYRHGLREMERLVHPSSVSGERGLGRRLQRQGAFIAWVFLMLFALTLAAINLSLAALGVEFQDAMVISVAGLTNTGPLLLVASDAPVQLSDLSATAKGVFVVAMVVGRMETLAIIALISPNLWRA